MDYKKSKAPVNTVTRNIMDCVRKPETFTRVLLSSLSVLTRFQWRSSRTSTRNLLSLLPTTTRLRRFLRIVSRLRSHATMRSFRSRRCLPLRSSLREMCIIATPLRTMPPFRSRLNVWRIYY